MALLAMLALACDSEPEACLGYGEPQDMGEVDEELDEVSGLAVSRVHENLVWAHNDKGDSSRVFAMGLNGSLRGTFALTGGVAEDLEDMAVDDEGRLWIADIGDNDRGRESVALMSVEEPSEPDDDGALETTLYELEYEDGPQDAEAMFVDEQGRAWVIDKVGGGKARLYRAELEAGLLVEEASFEVPGSGQSEVTAADLSPDGESLALRTPDRVLIYPRSADQGFDEVLQGVPCSAPAADEVQGEAIAFASWGYLTLSEGRGSSLFRYNQAD